MCKPLSRPSAKSTAPNRCCYAAVLCVTLPHTNKLGVTADDKHATHLTSFVGCLVVDSTDIAHEIERLFPEPAVLPTEPHLGGLSHALEDWADEALYFLGLYFQWIEPRGQPLVRKAFGSTPLGIVARVFYQRRIATQLRGQGTGRKSVIQITADLKREFAALSAMLAGQPYLLGDRPYLCDFAVNAQLVYMSRPPGSAEILREFAALGAYMERMKALRSAASRNDA